ncbi:hypothetical protein D3C75_730150 [compost metagenome]
MPVLANIALVVTLCAPGANAQVNECRQDIPQTWASSSMVEARIDWEACRGQESTELARPGAIQAQCRYTGQLGGAPSIAL